MTTTQPAENLPLEYGLLALGIALLPTLVAALVYRRLGRDDSPAFIVTKVVGGVLMACHMLVLVIVAALCAWTLSEPGPARLLAGATLLIAVLHGAGDVVLLHWPRRLIGWSLGSIVGLALALALLVGGAYAAFSGGHGAPLALMLALVLLPIVFSAGPLLAAPIVAIWQRNVRRLNLARDIAPAVGAAAGKLVNAAAAFRDQYIKTRSAEEQKGGQTDARDGLGLVADEDEV